LRSAQWPQPQPGPGQAAVQIAAAGVNYFDIYVRTGLYRQKLPWVPGREAAGYVTAVGDGVEGLEPGDAVVSVDFAGAYAEHGLAAANRLVPVPAGLPLDVAAACLLQGLTAHYLTESSYPVRAGDVVLVHAAAGGMGQLLTQVIKLHGGHVIGTVSTARKEKIAREAGADEVIRYSDGDFAAAVRHLTAGRGVRAVYDSVGQVTFDSSLACLAPRGSLVLCGQSSGTVAPFEIGRLARAGSISLTRPMMDDFIVSRDELLARADEVLGWVTTGKLTVRIGHRYRLADAAAAHEAVEQRRTVGKVLLMPRWHRSRTGPTLFGCSMPGRQRGSWRIRCHHGREVEPGSVEEPLDEANGPPSRAWAASCAGRSPLPCNPCGSCAAESAHRALRKRSSQATYRQASGILMIAVELPRTAMSRPNIL
jgi:NADPH:quinone reductase